MLLNLLFFLALTQPKKVTPWPQPIVDTYIEYRRKLRSSCIAPSLTPDPTVLQEFTTVITAATQFDPITEQDATQRKALEAEQLRYRVAAQQAIILMRTVSCTYERPSGYI